MSLGAQIPWFVFRPCIETNEKFLTMVRLEGQKGFTIKIGKVRFLATGVHAICTFTHIYIYIYVYIINLHSRYFVALGREVPLWCCR